MALDEAVFGSNPEYRRASRGRFRFLTFPFKLTFRLFKRIMAGVIRVLAYHPLSSLLVLVLTALAVFFGYQDYAHGSLSLTPGGSGRVEQISPSPAAEDFIKGQATFNASLMWQSFSDDFKQRLTQRGTNQQSLQRQLDQRKQSGAKIDQVQYAGGVKTAEGSRIFMYVLTMQAPDQGMAETHYVLTVDQTDKIVNVE